MTTRRRPRPVSGGSADAPGTRTTARTTASVPHLRSMPAAPRTGTAARPLAPWMYTP
ncbi:hypothetical protein [Streptomyces sp. V3I7]|uniref:hypothetical protein n=1 Tax=Streptomyces sp. V3I7 TaxID=3042278 RepID=UPI002781C76E|nr:hypothetical protein [Streptomyces sp. V3I7]MDQ0989691.1 hypothetical protein [Streptomyces sp. V3I7]